MALTNQNILLNGISSPTAKRNAAASTILDGVSSPQSKAIAQGFLLNNPTPQATQNDPAPNPYINNGGSGGSSATSAAENQSRLQIEQGINQYNEALGRLDGQQRNALGNLENDYNQASNRLLGQGASLANAFDTSKTNQLTDFVQAREDIGNNSRNLLVNARRLLGGQGAGGGSADRYALPNAAQMESSNKNAIVQKTNARNLAALTSTYDENKRNLDNSRADLDSQLERGKRSTQSQFEAQRSDILSNIAQLTGQKNILNGGNYESALAASRPYMDRVRSILDNIDRLSVNPNVIREQTVNFAKPQLADYTFDRFTAPTQNAAPAQDLGLSPAVAALLGYNQDQRQLI